MRRNKLESRRQASRTHRRRLSIEGLESRSLLAADCFHNFMMPEDADGSGDVSPLDALSIINGLNAAQFGEGGSSQGEAESPASNRALRMMDVDADAVLTPLDALVVINYLNETSAGNRARPSHIDIERRMAWLEKSIADGRLPLSYSMQEAYEALATLRAGGRPEMGQVWIDGRLEQRSRMTEGEPSGRADSSEDDLDVGDSGSGDAREPGGAAVEQPSRDPSEIDATDRGLDSRSEHRDYRRALATIMDRLAAIGTDEATLTEVRTKLVALLRRVDAEDSNGSFREQLQLLFRELGIEASKIFPEREAEHTRAWFDGLRARLIAAGVDEAVIATLATEVRSAVVAGVPMTWQQIRARLSELGVDWNALLSNRNPSDRPERIPSRELPTTRPPAPTPPSMADGASSADRIAHAELVSSLVRRLRMVDVKPEIVEAVVAELRASLAQGASWTLEQIRARLIELGVDVRRILPEPAAPNNDSDPTAGSPGEESAPRGFPMELLNRIDLRRYLPSLAQRGIAPDQIHTMLAEMRRAESLGKPLSVAQIVVRLKQLGVPIERWISPLA